MSCVEAGCEGATAFGYPEPLTVAVEICGDATPSVREQVTDIAGPCDRTLPFSGDGSFALYQCCCDAPG